jgi:hypothetical protein
VPFSFRDLVDQFLTSRRTFEFETSAFTTMLHDKHLVAKVQNQLTQIAEAYGYFTALVFETQGINDNGSDVSVRFRDLGTESDGPSRVLAYQIKSHAELAQKDVVQKIKAQRDDAFRKIPELAHYYVLLCGDELKLKRRLNAIRAEFLKAERTTVVSPSQALRFIRYEEYQIDAQVKRLMDESDSVLREMVADLSLLSDTAKALVCYLACQLLSHGTANSTCETCWTVRLAPCMTALSAPRENVMLWFTRRSHPSTMTSSQTSWVRMLSIGER